MFEGAENAANDTIKVHYQESIELPLINSNSLPTTYSLSQLITNVATRSGIADEEDKLRRILILRSCLENSTQLPQDGDDVALTQLSLWVSNMILPDPSILSLEDSITVSPPQDRVLLITRHKGGTGLLALQALIKTSNHPPTPIDPQILLSLVAFTSTRDSWTTATSLSSATALLFLYEGQTRSREFLIDYILQKFIRPLFSKSKPEAVTASGRKAMPSSAPPPRFDANNAEQKTKPWMIDTPYAITVFEWVVLQSSPEIARSHFNLYIPPLLTLLDSTLTPIRSRALSILSAFIPLLTPDLLRQTGLGEVFEDAITPTLMFLPSLTPVDESVQLLEPAYQALFVLGDILYERGGEEPEKKQKIGEYNAIEMKFWDRVVRKGVLMGYPHASEHPAIVEVLLQNLAVVIGKMGIHAVKHLKDILPILSTTLTDPFALSHPSLTMNAVKTLQTTILNCWPRMSEPSHKIEIITALSLCWMNVCQAPTENHESLEAVKVELSMAGRMLVKAVEGDEYARVGMKKDLDKLFETDEGLRVVFGMGDGE